MDEDELDFYIDEAGIIDAWDLDDIGFDGDIVQLEEI